VESSKSVPVIQRIKCLVESGESSETSAYFCQTKQRDITEDGIRHRSVSYNFGK